MNPSEEIDDEETRPPTTFRNQDMTESRVSGSVWKVTQVEAAVEI
jgi:hypothetical protein